MGLAALGLYAVAECAGAAREGRPRAAATALAIVLASSAVTLVTPYGVGLWSFLLSTVFLVRPYLIEWAPVPPGGLSFIDFKALCAVLILCVVVSRAAGTRWVLCVALLCAVAAFRHNRHIPFFAIAAAFALPEPLNETMRRLGYPFRGCIETKSRAKGSIALALSALVIASIPAYRGPSAVSLVVATDQYPVAAMNWMRKKGIRGNCAVFFNWGEYLIWHLRDAVWVSVDGRYDTVYPEKVLNDNFMFFFAGPEWRSLLADYPTEMVLAHPRNPIAGIMLKLPEWKMAFRSETACLFLKKARYPLFEQEETVVDATPAQCVPFP
jgi:hypothetical protein